VPGQVLRAQVQPRLQPSSCDASAVQVRRLLLVVVLILQQPSLLPCVRVVRVVLPREKLLSLPFTVAC